MRSRSASPFGASKTPRVAIIGAGFGGICAGVKLIRAGIDTFTIFEKSDGIGGTWWENRYPGAEVDTESNLYSFSFKPYGWTRTHAGRAELLRYIDEIVDEFHLRPHLRLRTAVKKAVWDEASHTYVLTLEDGREERCHVLISAVGFLNTPRFPDWPGLSDFRGPKFHTARWEDHDLRGKRVAVVGTGSSAAQIVPSIAPTVAQLYVFQREPASVMPKGVHEYTAAERAALERPLARRIDRAKLFLTYERNVFARRPGTARNQAATDARERYVRATFGARPELMEALIARYPMHGKRVVRDDNFYPALLRDNVTLVPHAVTRVLPSGIVDETGVERDVDVIVMATGFQAANFLASVEIVGRGGSTLQQAWAGDPKAFLGITVPGFPNFYMLYGPNTNGLTILFNLEQQAGYAVSDVRRMARSGITSLEVRPAFMAAYDRWLQRRLAKFPAWTVANNYYKSPSGRVVTQWPGGAFRYWLMTRLLRRISSRAGRRSVTREVPEHARGDAAPRVSHDM